MLSPQIIPFIAAFFIIGAVIIVFILSKRRETRFKQRFGMLAKELNGYCKSISTFGEPSLFFQADGRSGRFYLIQQKSSPSSAREFSTVEITLNRQAQQKLTVVSEGISSFFSKIVKGDTKVHDPEFDNRFVVQSDNQTSALNILSADARRTILEIDKMGIPDIPDSAKLVRKIVSNFNTTDIKLAKNLLKITRNVNFEEPEVARRFILTSLRLAKEMGLA